MVGIAVGALAVFARPGASAADLTGFPRLAFLVAPDEVTPSLVGRLKERGAGALVVVLDAQWPRDRYGAVQTLADAAELPLYGWIEVGRNPVLAEQHPELLASIGAHADWRRRFPAFPAVPADSVVKAFPWVPIWYRRAYSLHLERVRRLVRVGPPRLAGVLLNDLQGAPSACGCGNDQCRWTVDYRVPSTAQRFAEADTPARFVAEVRRLVPGRPVIPVWTAECEEVDQAEHGQSTGYCATVGCYRGACWRRYAEQLRPLAHATEDPIGVAAFSKSFGRDRAPYDRPGGWIGPLVDSFVRLPVVDEPGVPAGRLVVVLEGWNGDRQRIAAELQQCAAAGVMGTVVAITPVDQGWTPRIVRRKPPPS
ncbi:MAG: hypothetical protein ACOC46_04840 [Pirellulales bacterium]